MLYSPPSPNPQHSSYATGSLSDLAAAIRTEHAAVVSALRGAVEHAIRCGKILADAKEQTGHGRWTEFVRTCGIGDRTARQYMQLAHLAEQNRTRGTDLAEQNGTGGTDLAGMTIKGAIKHLARPKTIHAPKQPTAKPTTVAPVHVQSKRNTKHVDIIEAWLGASPTDRAKAIDAIGLEALLTAIPPAWLPLLADRLTDRPVVVPVTFDSASIPEDLSIPDCLHRTPTPPVPVEEEPQATTTPKPRRKPPRQPP